MLGERIASLHVAAYNVRTNAPESDGTLQWNSTTIVLVSVSAGGQTGVGYTYSETAAAQLIADKLRAEVEGGEKALLPAVRKSPVDALILADGFSCQEQIEQLTDRRAMHIAQVLEMAFAEKAHGRISQSYPERNFRQDHSPEQISGRELLAGAAGVAAGIALTTYLQKQP